MAAVALPRGSPVWWEEVHALLVLDASYGTGRSKVRATVDAFGSGRDAVRGRRPGSRMPGGKAGARLGELRRRADRALDQARALGMEVVIWEDAEYPSRLRHLHDPPPVLFGFGRLDLLAEECVTIVGSRRATESGRDTAARLGAALARRGVTTVSGLALGIDGAVHGGSLGAGGTTIAVLGTGADVAYPRAHLRLYRAIREKGLVLSEFVPGTPALPYHFPRRNRILAALARHVVVVEAGEKSGSLITVDHALDLGREVWAVPGRIDAVAALGSNRLLADGARPLVSSELFLDAVTPAEGRGPEAPSGSDPVLGMLRSGPRSVEELAADLGCAVPDVMARLTRLELQGSVRRLAGLRFVVAA